MIELSNRLQILQPPILPPCGLDLQDCYSVHNNESVSVGEVDRFSTIRPLCREIMDALLSPIVDGDVPLLTTLYNITSDILLDADGRELK